MTKLTLLQAIGEAVELPRSVPTHIHLSPRGTFSAKDGRGPWTIEDAGAVITSSLARAAGGVLPIDYDHAIDRAVQSGAPAPAAGWIVRMEARADGVWGEVEWTPRARALIGAGEYRFISPVLLHATDGRVHRIARAALTNNPALELKALNSRQPETGADTMTMEELLAELRKVLGLPDDADASAALEAVRKATGADASALAARPDNSAEIAALRSELAALRGDFGAVVSDMTRREAESYVDGLITAGRVFPPEREGQITALMRDPEGTRALLSFRPSIHDGRRVQDPGKAPPQVNEVHRRLGLSADDVQKYGRGA